MRQHYYRDLCLRIAAVLVMVITFSLTTASPALAFNLQPSKYYKLIYGRVTFDKSMVAAGESFHAIIIGRVICEQDLPLFIGAAYVATQIVAEPANGGPKLLLNPGYNININPMPKKAGEMFYFNQSVTLQFPDGATPGNYAVVGQLIEAKVKINLLWVDVTGFFPRELTLGAVTCYVAGPEETPTPTIKTITPLPSIAQTLAVTTVSPSTITTLPSQTNETTSPPSTTAPASPTFTPTSSTTNLTDWTPPPPTNTFYTNITVIILGIVSIIIIIVVVALAQKRQ